MEGISWDTVWLAHLARLRRLESLSFTAAYLGPAQQAQAGADAPAAAAQQAAQPLVVPPLSALTYLSIKCGRQIPLALHIDFCSLPSMAELVLEAEHATMTGAATFAGATALRRLRLGSTGAPWAAELLCHAPPSLRRLDAEDSWGPQAAPAIAALTQLRVLSLHTHGGAPPTVADGPVWPQLRALYWGCWATLPEVSNI